VDPGKRGDSVGYKWITEVLRIATLKECYKTDRFFTTSGDPAGSYSQTLLHILPKKDTRHGLRKIPEVRKNKTICIRNSNFLIFLLNDLMRNLTLKYCCHSWSHQWG
jgi:hypothetical protein